MSKVAHIARYAKAVDTIGTYNISTVAHAKGIPQSTYFDESYKYARKIIEQKKLNKTENWDRVGYSKNNDMLWDDLQQLWAWVARVSWLEMDRMNIKQPVTWKEWTTLYNKTFPNRRQY